MDKKLLISLKIILKKKLENKFNVKKINVKGLN